MPSAEKESQGKAWWVQLQRQRAVEAGCLFYTRRPATNTSSPSVPQPATQTPNAKTHGQARPATVGSCNPSLEGAQGRYVSIDAGGIFQNASFAMRPGTSPKLPARRALANRQATRSQLSSTATSCIKPASRGNDWSPVHSRPATRSAAGSVDLVHSLAAAKGKLSPDTSMALPADTKPILTLAAGVTAATVQSNVGAASRPPRSKHRQHRTPQSSLTSNQSSSSKVPCCCILSASLQMLA